MSCSGISGLQACQKRNSAVALPGLPPCRAHRLLLAGARSLLQLLLDQRSGGLLIHPVVQPRFLEAPAVAELKGGHKSLGGILVEGVRADSEVVGCLADIHHLTYLYSTHRRRFHGRSSRKLVGIRGRGPKPGALCISCFAHHIQELPASMWKDSVFCRVF